MEKQKIWPSKQKIYQQTLRRLTLQQLQAIYQQACQLEETLKGLSNNNLKHGVSHILLKLAGQTQRQQYLE